VRIAVLGAGLQGACVAMELASRGAEVHVYDKNDVAVSQASAKSEAKIHLGYLYSNDPTLKTARTLMQGAVSFAPLLRRWIGNDIDRVPVSDGYYYVVPEDSLVCVDAIEQYFQQCTAIARDEINAASDAYFGMDFRRGTRRLDSYDRLFDPSLIIAAFETPEIGLGAEVLASFVRNRLVTTPGVRCIMGATVCDVMMQDKRGEVEFEIGSQLSTAAYDHVVNALWDGRLEIDARAGHLPRRPWLFRLKFNLRVPNVPAHPLIPSFSMTLGPYGDLVRYANDEMYISWYPSSLKAKSAELTPPAAWPQALYGAEAYDLKESILRSMSRYVPAIADIAPHCLAHGEITGGVIFAWAATDIDDPQSELHRRDDIGPISYGRYHTINTGKLTTAPLFAEMMADAILPH
jgi:hypothetical protein